MIYNLYINLISYVFYLNKINSYLKKIKFKINLSYIIDIHLIFFNFLSKIYASKKIFYIYW